MKKISRTKLLQAIRRQCLDCTCGKSIDIQFCMDNYSATKGKRQCPLYNYRMATMEKVGNKKDFGSNVKNVSRSKAKITNVQKCNI